MLHEDEWRKTILGPAATLQEAIAHLDNSGLQIVLVASPDGVLLGTLTDGDIRRAILNQIDLSANVSVAMQRNPFTAGADLSREAALNTLRHNQIMHLPIVDHDRRLLGMHTLNDSGSSHFINNTIVIMAGGKGKRMMPLTANRPKPMLEVGGKPMMLSIIEGAKNAGITDIIVSINHLGDVIEEFFEDGGRFGVSIKYLREEMPLGTAGGLFELAGKLTSTCIVSNGDIVSNVNYRHILDYHKLQNASATMAVRSYEIQNPFGVVETLGSDIVSFIEKPIYTSYINAGIYALSPEAFDPLQKGEFCDMPTLFDRLRAQDKRTVAFPMHEGWSDIGNPNELKSIREKMTRNLRNNDEQGF